MVKGVATLIAVSIIAMKSATEAAPVDSTGSAKGEIPGELRRPTESFGSLRHA